MASLLISVSCIPLPLPNHPLLPVSRNRLNGVISSTPIRVNDIYMYILLSTGLEIVYCMHAESRPILDVNQAPSAAAGRNSEEDGGVSSPNSRASSATAKRSTEREAGSRGVSDEEDDGDGCRKKLRLSKDQSAILEESFKEHSTLNPKQKVALAKQLNLRPRQVEVWFQNRRARTKLKQTEVDCELLRRCCQDLTEENRRLHKEVLELRALKLSPQLYMHMTPPTTLTLCPSCERACGSTSAALASASSSRNQPPAEYHQFFHQQRPVAAPWAPIQLRPSFLDAPPQRS